MSPLEGRDVGLPISGTVSIHFNILNVKHIYTVAYYIIIRHDVLYGIGRYAKTRLSCIEIFGNWSFQKMCNNVELDHKLPLQFKTINLFLA